MPFYISGLIDFEIDIQTDNANWSQRKKDDQQNSHRYLRTIQYILYIRKNAELYFSVASDISVSILYQERNAIDVSIL